MKLLCLFVILVNLFVAMYEFKYDVDYGMSGSAAENIQPGQEKILLVSEATKAKPDIEPAVSSQAGQTNDKPSSPDAGAGIQLNPPNLGQDIRKTQTFQAGSKTSPDAKPEVNQNNKVLP